MKSKIAVVLAAVLLLASCTASKPEATETETPLTPEAQVIVREISVGDTGEDVVKMETRLKALGYYSGEYTQKYTDEMGEAVFLFERHNGIIPDKTAEIETQELLFSENAKSFDDAIYDLAPTTHMEYAELVGDNGDREKPAGYPKEDTYRITVDIANQLTLIYAKDAEGNYTVPVRYMLSSTGLHDATPVGKFKMNAYRVRFSKFARDGRYGQYWTQIYNAFYFHTALYSAGNASSYISETFSELGKPASHGCVRLTVPDARWMWYNIAPGTVCEIRRGTKDDAELAAIRQKLTLAEPPAERLTLSPETLPYTDNWRIEDVPHDVPYVQGKQNSGRIMA